MKALGDKSSVVVIHDTTPQGHVRLFLFPAANRHLHICLGKMSTCLWTFFLGGKNIVGLSLGEDESFVEKQKQWISNFS